MHQDSPAVGLGAAAEDADGWAALPAESQTALALSSELVGLLGAACAQAGQASAAEAAGSLRDAAAQSMRMRPVTAAMRAVFMTACVAEAAAHLYAAAPPADDPEMADADDADAARTASIRLALNALDRGLLVSGAPVAAAEALAWVAALQAHLAAVDRHPLMMHPAVHLADGLGPHDPPPARVAAVVASIDAASRVPVCMAPLSASQFQRRMLDGRPFVIRGAIDGWPCFGARPWTSTAQWLESVGADRLVPVEVGAAYTDPDWTQRLVPMAHLIEHMLECEDQDDGDRATAGSGVGGSQDSSTDARPPRMYLAQFDLFAQAPHLDADAPVPDLCLAPPARPDGGSDGRPHDVIRSVWLGPGGTVSPLHTDPHDNLFAQIVGFKRVRMAAPADTPRVYPHAAASLMANTARVDVERPDAAAFPLFGGVRLAECVVGPGDMLFIPRGWWHHVRSLTSSASVSFWF
ncbi:hypothetical protein HK105_207144 [Polyrhizophydium stewartii]|uniref:JmjC domain-containing protein n=1 Tax=Polyrhizophydium stewartii TaxID=2732419 RepID=A0ABR4N1M2_9FUNG